MSALKMLVAIKQQNWQEYLTPLGKQPHKISFNFEKVRL
jgi:hypothetical protein